MNISRWHRNTSILAMSLSIDHAILEAKNNKASVPVVARKRQISESSLRPQSQVVPLRRRVRGLVPTA